MHMSKIITWKLSGILSRNEEFIVSMKVKNIVIKRKLLKIREDCISFTPRWTTTKFKAVQKKEYYMITSSETLPKQEVKI